MIRVTQEDLVFPNLPDAAHGLRIVHLTDLHRSHRTTDALLRHVVEHTNAARPDLVLLTGDYVTQDPADITPCAEILSHLKARLGVYAVLGNHDYGTDGPAMSRALTDIGIHLLVNRSVRLENGLQLVGIDDDILGHPNLKEAFADIDPACPVIVLWHNPAAAEKITDRACVMLAGHTHGGQIRVPLVTAWKVRKIRAKHYLHGWFTLGKVRLYVNRGIGNVGLSFRFRSAPEIAVFTLAQSNSSERT